MQALVIAIMTVLVPLIPLGTRRYFISKSDIAVESLRIEDPPRGRGIQTGVPTIDNDCEPDLSTLDNDCIVRSLDYGEPGFQEFEETIRQHRSLKEEVRAFHLIWGNISEISTSLCLQIPTQGTSIANGVLCAEHRDGSFSRVIFNPLDLDTTANLTEVQTWSRETATIQSNRVTVTLVFVWFAVALWANVI